MPDAGSTCVLIASLFSQNAPSYSSFYSMAFFYECLETMHAIFLVSVNPCTAVYKQWCKWLKCFLDYLHRTWWYRAAIQRAVNSGSWKVSCISHLWKTDTDIFALLGWYCLMWFCRKSYQKSFPCKQPYDLQEAVKRSIMALFDRV